MNPLGIGRNTILAALLLTLLPAVGSAQITWTKGRPWKGSPGITETVAQIMRRPSNPPGAIYETKDDETEPIFRGLPQNPASPEVSRFPFETTPTPRPPITTPLFSLGTSWNGGVLGESSAIPPDTMGDVSPTQVLMAVNGRIKIFDRNGAVGALNTTTNSFFNSVRTASTGTSDPRVRWDRLVNRWILVMIDVKSANNRVMIAVSNSATVTNTSSFTFFQFSYAAPTPAGNTSAFCDYPTIGTDAKSLYIGGNIFFSGGVQTDMFVVNKTQLLAGTLNVSAFRGLGVDSSTQQVTGPWTPHGVDNDDPNATEGYVLGADLLVFGKLDLRRITYDASGVPSMSSNIAITTPSTSEPKDVVAQGSTPLPLDALDHRLYTAKMFRNRLTGVATIWTAQNYGTNTTGVASGSPDRTGGRWYEIQGFQTGQTPSLLQAGSVFDSAASNPINYWVSTIAMTGQGYALLCCSSAGATRAANVAFAQRNPGDPLGTMQTPVAITSSTSAYNVQTSSSRGSQRWGDYSHTTVDPADGQSIWTFQEYCNANNSWGIRIARLLAPPPTIDAIAPADAFPTETVNVVVSGHDLFDPGPTFPNRLSATISGTGVTINSVTFTSPTQATVNLSVTSPAAAGARTLTLKNPDGQTVATTFTVKPRVGSGTVILGDWTASMSGTPVTFEVIDAGNNVVQTATANLDVLGTYSFAPTVAPGTYSVTAKAGHWLRKKVTGVTITAAGFSGVNFTLTNGDVNGDNAVTLADFADLRAAFGSSSGDGTWNPNADLNGDGSVTLADFAILRSRFGSSGD